MDTVAPATAGGVKKKHLKLSQARIENRLTINVIRSPSRPSTIYLLPTCMLYALPPPIDAIINTISISLPAVESLGLLPTLPYFDNLSLGLPWKTERARS